MFYLSAGIAALVAVGGMITVEPDQPSEEEDKRVDWVGSALITAGLTLIIFVLSEAAIAPRGWRTPCEYQRSLASSADPHLLGISEFKWLTLTCSHHRMSRGRRHLERDVLLLERIPLQDSRLAGEIVEGLVEISSFDPWRFVVPCKWAVLGDSHGRILDLVFIPF